MTFTKNGVGYPLRLMPGMNRIKDKDIIACIHDDSCNKLWKDMLKRSVAFPHGCHEVILGQEPGVQNTNAFTTMDAATCIQIVSETGSILELELMHADEAKSKGRKTVLQAILDQIESQKSDEAGKH